MKFMIIIVCLDDNDGMLFNGRRQSRDGVLCQKIIELSKNSTLLMSPYSKPLFDDEVADFQSDEAFLELAQSGEYCFVENKNIETCLPKTEMVIIFRWNRNYPSDVKFPMHLLENWKKTEVTVFPGKSHDKITQEVYIP